MWIANVLSAVTIFSMGLFTRVKKASYLIAGYNTMSREEKAKYDEKALTDFVGNLLMVSAAVLIVPLVLLFVVDQPFFVVSLSWILFTLFIIGGVIYANTGNRFLKGKND